MEEVLLYTENIEKASAEVENLGGQVKIQIGHDLLITSVPRDVASQQDAFAHSSTQISSTASPTARHGAKIYKMYLEDQLGPEPEIQKWTAKTAPKSFPQPEPLPENGPSTPTMKGKIAVGLLLPSGPGSLAISDAEMDKAISKVFAGLQFWQNRAPSSAGLSFVFFYGRASITASNPSYCSDYASCHDVFATPVLAKFGYDSKTSLAEVLKTYTSATGAFIAFISKYRQARFAYAFFNGGPVYMQYSNDGWGPDKLDRLFAHVVGHVFNAPDEYSGCNCNTLYGKGDCTAKNTNCASCTGSQTDCIMDSYQLGLCSYTKKHIGWC